MCRLTYPGAANPWLSPIDSSKSFIVCVMPVLAVSVTAFNRAIFRTSNGGYVNLVSLFRNEQHVALYSAGEVIFQEGEPGDKL
ncbi:MAG: hypothetical protein AAF387_17475 [Pseudomonadota bacterium]